MRQRAVRQRAVPLSLIRSAAIAGAVAVLAAGCGDDGDTDARSAPTAEMSPVTREPTDATGSTTTSGPATTPSTTAAPGTATTAGTTTAAPGVRVALEVVDGQVVGGPPRVEVPLGDPVEVAVTADVAEEIHVHGYDLTADALAGEVATLRFVADIPGVFEVELEGTHLLIATLVVS